MLFFEAIGVLTTMVIVAYFLMIACFIICQILREQRKIKCLCKHEYIVRCKWKYSNHTEFDLECRKCKKVKRITIWDDSEGIEDECTREDFGRD